MTVDLRVCVTRTGVRYGLRKHGSSEHIFYRRKARYGGLDVSDARRLKSLEDENRLKTLVDDLTLDDQMLKAVAQRKWVRRQPAPIVSSS